MMRFAMSRPGIKALALDIACRSAALQSWLIRFAAARGITAGSTFVHVYPDYTRPTPGALRIYNDLLAAIDEKRQEGQM